MKREEQLERLVKPGFIWDIVVIGGGATGLGVALDAASRGFSVALIEQSDFAKATSSRSTKLVHGGVRYLAQGNVGLVLEALKERGLLLVNAPHLVRNQSFIIPNYRWWEGIFYSIGLKFYDFLSGKYSFGSSLHISRKDTGLKLPLLKSKGLYGGVLYHDGQFDDSRLAINVAQTCIEHNGCVVNYMKATALTKDIQGKISGVKVTDVETNRTYELKAKVVVNATGVFADSIMQMDTPEAHDIVRPSQGVHVVLDQSFLNSSYAIMIPKTSDGRVLFAVPWHNRVVVGTTDTVREKPELEPLALDKEIEFILNTAGKYLKKIPSRKDVLSVFAGLRPLAAPQNGDKSTKEISRSHKIITSDSGLISIIGGKWTTFRKMGEDTVNEAISAGALPKIECRTQSLRIHGFTPHPSFNDHLYVYGSDAVLINELEEQSPELREKLHPNFEYRASEVVWSARYEMARTVEDVLARRLRALFLDARASIEMAPEVARILAKELNKNDLWAKDQITAYAKLAKRYLA